MPDTERTITTDIPTTAAGNLFVDQDVIAEKGDASSPTGSGSVDDAVGIATDGGTTEASEDSGGSGDTLYRKES